MRRNPEARNPACQRVTAPFACAGARAGDRRQAVSSPDLRVARGPSWQSGGPPQRLGGLWMTYSACYPMHPMPPSGRFFFFFFFFSRKCGARAMPAWRQNILLVHNRQLGSTDRERSGYVTMAWGIRCSPTRSLKSLRVDLADAKHGGKVLASFSSSFVVDA